MALFDIENHLSPQWKKIDYYVNFIYAGKKFAAADPTARPKEGVVGFEYTFRFENGIVVYVYSKNAGGILVSDSLRVDDNWVFERKNGSFCIDKQQFPMEETIENNLGSNADIFI